MVTTRPTFRNREFSACSVIPAQVDFTTAGTVVEDGLALTRLTFRNCLGESVHATAIVPAEPAGTLPGVICTNGTASTAEDVANPLYHRETPHKGPLYGWGREMVRRGFAVHADEAVRATRVLGALDGVDPSIRLGRDDRS